MSLASEISVQRIGYLSLSDFGGSKLKANIRIGCIMSDISDFIDYTLTESQKRLDEMTRTLLGTNVELEPAVTINVDEIFEQYGCTDELTTSLGDDIVGQITDDFAHKTIMRAIIRTLPKENIAIDWHGPADDLLRSQEKLIVALTRHSSRPLHDQSERVIVVSKGIYYLIKDILSSHPNIDGMIQSHLFYTGMTLHGGRVFIDPLLKDDDGTLILKDGWFEYTGSGAFSRYVKGSLSFYNDIVASIDPNKIVHISHENSRTMLFS